MSFRRPILLLILAVLLALAWIGCCVQRTSTMGKASDDVAEGILELTDVIREFKPTQIYLSHPGDHNPDHRALYLFTRVALWDLSSELTSSPPILHPYLVHVPLDWTSWRILELQ